MEKTSLALRLVRISLEIGSQIDSKCHKNWLAKATRIGLENHENGIRYWLVKTIGYQRKVL